MKSRILLFIISILVSSCISVEICDEDSNSVLVTKFKTLKDEIPSDSVVSDLTLYGIREGMPDSLLYNLKSNFKKSILHLTSKYFFSPFFTHTLA